MTGYPRLRVPAVFPRCCSPSPSAGGCPLRPPAAAVPWPALPPLHLPLVRTLQATCGAAQRALSQSPCTSPFMLEAAHRGSEHRMWTSETIIPWKLPLLVERSTGEMTGLRRQSGLQSVITEPHLGDGILVGGGESSANPVKAALAPAPRTAP